MPVYRPGFSERVVRTAHSTTHFPSRHAATSTYIKKTRNLINVRPLVSLATHYQLHKRSVNGFSTLANPVYRKVSVSTVHRTQKILYKNTKATYNVSGQIDVGKREGPKTLGNQRKSWSFLGPSRVPTIFPECSLPTTIVTEVGLPRLTHGLRRTLITTRLYYPSQIRLSYWALNIS